jgi:hypothetical protein
MFDSYAFDAFLFGKGLRGPNEVGIRWGHISQALAVELITVVLDDGADLGLEVPRPEVVLQQECRTCMKSKACRCLTGIFRLNDYKGLAGSV